MSRHELEDENSESPPVHCVRVSTRGNQLRCEVIWGATCGEGLANDKLCQAHVGKLDMAARCQKKILRLEVTVDDAAHVEMLESENNACGVVSAMLLHAVQAFPVVGGVELAAEARLKEEVEGLCSVVSFVELRDERRVCHDQNVLLIHDAFLHASLHDVALAQSLECVGILRRLMLPKLHGPEATAAKQADSLQIRTQDLDGGLSTSFLTWPLHPLISYFSSLTLLGGLQDVLERTEENVEGLTIQDQALCRR
mmetsp:Transcript_22682/g.41054  ORF Transcript_22682/g.41054 Transcript_22682/m.41054 type:complete len:254 (-) Transcript_22682:1355-2116(-)